MSTAKDNAANRARAILEEEGIVEAPIPVDDIARRLGAQLTFEPFRGGISGMLYRDQGRKVIGVNSAHPSTRQRFTIAHELGHLLLHESRKMIVDSHIFRRDEMSSMGTETEEIEANAFAAELLMPADLVDDSAHDLVTESPTITAHKLVAALAEKFDVSTQAMEIRLGEIGILSPLLVAGG